MAAAAVAERDEFDVVRIDEVADRLATGGNLLLVLTEHARARVLERLTARTDARHRTDPRGAGSTPMTRRWPAGGKSRLSCSVMHAA